MVAPRLCVCVRRCTAVLPSLNAHHFITYLLCGESSRLYIFSSLFCTILVNYSYLRFFPVHFVENLWNIFEKNL
uniref:Uncharacterized protein n=1 Tax=Parascaris univalens TaxID=6257 RepID=A0A914ZPP3_PARUN